MSEMLSRFSDLFEAHEHYVARDWINIDCPFCHDQRKRFGMRPTETGGFRVKCFNGGCDYQTPAGWEPGSPFVGRIRRVFDLLGGDITKLPLKEFLSPKQDRVRGPKMVTQTSFPEVPLPGDANFLSEVKNADADACRSYLNWRSPLYLEHPFLWFPDHPKHVILPYLHRDSIVGWLGRSISMEATGADRFIQRAPTDYMFNQSVVFRGDAPLYVFESPFDAVLFNGIGVRNSILTQHQINLLNLSKRPIILIPDRGVEGKSFIDQAEQNNWYVSVPPWETGIKDAGESVQSYGLLYSIKLITDNISTNYTKAKMLL